MSHHQCDIIYIIKQVCSLHREKHKQVQTGARKNCLPLQRTSVIESSEIPLAESRVCLWHIFRYRFCSRLFLRTSFKFKQLKRFLHFALYNRHKNNIIRFKMILSTCFRLQVHNNSTINNNGSNGNNINNGSTCQSNFSWPNSQPVASWPIA